MLACLPNKLLLFFEIYLLEELPLKEVVLAAVPQTATTGGFATNTIFLLFLRVIFSRWFLNSRKNSQGYFCGGLVPCTLMVGLLEAIFLKLSLKTFFATTNHLHYISTRENLSLQTFTGRHFSVSKTINSCNVNACLILNYQYFNVFQPIQNISMWLEFR